MKKLTLFLAILFAASGAYAIGPTDTPTITPTPTKTWTPDNSAQYLYVAPKNNSYIAKYSWPAAQFLGYINLSLAGNEPITSLHGFTRDSNGHYWLIIQKNDGRYLCTLDINTGAVNPVRTLDTFVTSLALDDAGNVYTVTGGESPDKRFWVSTVDASGHVSPLAFDGDGDSGQGIAFDYDQHRIIHSAGNPLNRLDYFDLPLSGTSAPVMINGDMLNSGIGSTTHSLAYAGHGDILLGVDESVYLADASGVEKSLLLSVDDNVMGMVLSHDNATLQPAPAAAAGQSYYWIPNAGTTLNQYSLSDLSLLRSQALSLSYSGESLNNVYGMARNPKNGDIWVTGQSSSTFDNNNNFIGKLQTSTGVITQVTGTGEAIYSLAFKPTGELFASTTSNGTHQNSILKVGFDGSVTQLLSKTASTLNGWSDDARALAYNSGDGNFYLACQYDFENLISFSGNADIHSIRTVVGSIDSLWGRSDALQLYQPGWMLAQFGSYVVALSQSGEHRIYGKINSYGSSTQGPALVAGNLIPTDTPTPSFSNTPTGSNTPTITDTPTITQTPSQTFSATPTFTGTPYASLSGMRIYAADHDHPLIHEFDPSTGKDSRVLSLFMDAGSSAPKALAGLAMDPSSGIYYVTGDTSAGGYANTRRLYSVDMGNGKAVDLGPSPYVAGIAFDSAGNLYGAMGCNGSLSGHAVSIDKSNGALTDLLDMSNCGGATLYFRPQDGQLYAPMGNSYYRLAAISITAASSVDVSNTGLGEFIFGEVRASAGLSDGNFVMNDDQGRIVAMNALSGVLMGQVASFPYSVKGMIVSSPIVGFATKPYFTPQPRLTVPASTLLLGADVQDANLVTIDPVSFTVTGQFGLTGVSNITGYSGLAYDSVGGLIYAVARINGNSVRHLISFDSSGAATDIGDLGDDVSGIAFDGSGTLYGVMGQGSSRRGQIAPINKSSALIGASVATSGSNGVSIAYDPDNSLFYTASGSGFNSLSSYDPASSFSSSSVTPPSGQSRVDAALALVYLGNGTFILEDRNSTLRYLKLDGSFEAGNLLHNPFSGNSELKGLALVPALSVPTPVPTATFQPTPSGKALLALPAFSSVIYKVALDHPDQIISSYPLSVAGYSFDTNMGLALDPISGLYYLIMAQGGGRGTRYLVTFNLSTGKTAVVGAFPTDSYIASLACDASGQLYGVYGNEASSNSGSMTAINKTDATLGTAFASTNSGGQAIAFNPVTGGIFKAAGSGPIQWDEIDTVALNVSSTVGISRTFEIQGLGYYQNGTFLLSASNHLYTVTQAGQMDAVGSLPGNQNYKGLAVVSDAPFPTPTVTPQRTNTPVFTPTPAGFMGSGKGFSVVGPVPAKRGEPICLAFPAAPQSSRWELYNTAGQLVAKLSFGSESSQCWDHPNVAAGLYYLKLKVTTANGDEERWQKIAIVP